jgi:hypothetical protein
MANVVRHYNQRGPSQTAINNGLPIPGTVVSSDQVGGVNLQIDDSEVQDADEVMASLGCIPGDDHPHPLWDKYTLSYADLAAAALQNDVALFGLPARGMIKDVVIKHSAAFGGGSIASYTLSVGIAGNFTKYAPAFDVFQAPGNTVFQLSTVQGLENFGAVTPIRAQAIATGANLNAATQGSVDIWVLWTTLPA